MPSALLVDDTAPDEGIGWALSKIQPGMRILGTAASVCDALGFVETTHPDFVYMRWEMVGKLEAAALNYLTTRCKVVFVTAYGSHPIHTMEFKARETDGVMKPVRKALSNPELQPWNPNIDFGTEVREAVRRVDNLSQAEVIPIDEILWIEAAQNYTKVQRTGASQGALFHRSMAAWERILPCHSFRRLSRSVIVRVPSIEILTSHGRDSTTVSFRGSKMQLRLGRTAALRLKAWFRHPH